MVYLFLKKLKYIFPKDIHDALIQILNRYAIDVSEITCITTDGAASMIGIRNGVVAKVK